MYLTDLALFLLNTSLNLIVTLGREGLHPRIVVHMYGLTFTDARDWGRRRIEENQRNLQIGFLVMISLLVLACIASVSAFVPLSRVSARSNALSMEFAGGLPGNRGPESPVKKSSFVCFVFAIPFNVLQLTPKLFSFIKLLNM